VSVTKLPSFQCHSFEKAAFEEQAAAPKVVVVFVVVVADDWNGIENEMKKEGKN